MKRARFFSLIFLCFSFSGSLSAMTLEFDGPTGYSPFPHAGDGVIYDAVSESLTITYSEVWDGSPNPFDGLFEITANVDNAGNFLGGNVQWTGGDADLGIAAGTLLYQADITDMYVDYDSIDDYFVGIEFAFNTTFAHSAISLGDQAGIQVYTEPPFDGATVDTAFASSFTTGYYTHADMGKLAIPVPEPSPLALIALGLLLAPVVKFRDRKNNL